MLSAVEPSLDGDTVELANLTVAGSAFAREIRVSGRLGQGRFGGRVMRGTAGAIHQIGLLAGSMTVSAGALLSGCVQEHLREELTPRRRSEYSNAGARCLNPRCDWSPWGSGPGVAGG